MSANLAAQHNLATRLAAALRRFEHEGGNLEALAEAVGETPRDLRRWGEGTKMPGHVLLMVLGELPRHLADALIRPTGLRLIARDEGAAANPLRVMAQASGFVANLAERHADGHFCHRDRAATAAEAKRLIAELQPLAGE